MRFFLTAKHWQIFLLLIVGLFINNFTYVGQPEITIICRVTGILIYFSWLLFVGHGLYDYLPRKIEMSYNLFIINFFIWVTAYTVIIIYSDGQGMTFTGLAAIPFFYVAFAFLHVLIFPGRLLKSIELGQKAGFGDYIGTVVLMFFWPIGIWIIQPKINEIAKGNLDKVTAE